MVGGTKVLRQTISREDALIAHTRKNAYFLFQEDNLGSIQAGKLADLVVVDRDYLTIPADSNQGHSACAHDGWRPDRVRRRGTHVNTVSSRLAWWYASAAGNFLSEAPRRGAQVGGRHERRDQEPDDRAGRRRKVSMPTVFGVKSPLDRQANPRRRRATVQSSSEPTSS